MKKCCDWREPFQVVKNVYLRYILSPASDIGRGISSAKSLRDICAAFDLAEYHDASLADDATRPLPEGLAPTPALPAAAAEPNGVDHASQPEAAADAESKRRRCE
mmetsp:Transcript_58972/g.128208  ORF Transcript_58972/g.128208 Transcript_58972/m.128208 type:complete len:105 (-) Transcript_58972:107-421(-)